MRRWRCWWTWCDPRWSWCAGPYTSLCLIGRCWIGRGGTRWRWIAGGLRSLITSVIVSSSLNRSVFVWRFTCVLSSFQGPANPCSAFWGLHDQRCEPVPTLLGVSCLVVRTLHDGSASWATVCGAIILDVAFTDSPIPDLWLLGRCRYEGVIRVGSNSEFSRKRRRPPIRLIGHGLFRATSYVVHSILRPSVGFHHGPHGIDLKNSIVSAHKVLTRSGVHT